MCDEQLYSRAKPNGFSSSFPKRLAATIDAIVLAVAPIASIWLMLLSFT